MKRAQMAVILGFALVGGIGGVLLGRHFATPSVPPLPQGTVVLEEGAKRPDAELRRLDGSTAKLSDFDGRPLLINFWATWCPPCIEELPLLDALHQRSGADGLQVIGIALDDPAAVEKFLGEVPVEFPMFLAKPGRVDLSTTLGNANSVLPYSVLIDAEGRIAKRKFGAFSEASLREWVAGFE
ncbi:MAG: TlpA family protein disulfide reductase [Aquimonas sp.]|jgi:thiol-disulfide isomerase/thioredoxin